MISKVCLLRYHINNLAKQLQLYISPESNGASTHWWSHPLNSYRLLVRVRIVGNSSLYDCNDVCTCTTVNVATRRLCIYSMNEATGTIVRQLHIAAYSAVKAHY